jgi:predicted component of type VI protein secretion system
MGKRATSEPEIEGGKQMASQQVYLECLIEDPSSDESPRSIQVEHLPSVVGRAPECDYQISNPLVSRQHCRLFEKDNKVWLCDLHSRNGTHVNGQRVTGDVPIRDGDRVDIGFLPYRVSVSEPSRLGKIWKEMTGKR